MKVEELLNICVKRAETESYFGAKLVWSFSHQIQLISLQYFYNILQFVFNVFHENFVVFKDLS
jgi:hypothetical protein